MRQRLLRLPDGAQGVRMKLDDIFAAPTSILKKLCVIYLQTSMLLIGLIHTVICLVQFKWKKQW